VAFDLARMAQRKGVKRKKVKIRPIKPRPAVSLELQAIYRVVPDLWAENIVRIMEPYKPASITTDSPEDMARTIDIVFVEIARATVNLGMRLRGWTRKAERMHREQWREGVLAATSVDLGTVLSEGAVTETVESVLARNTALIRDINEGMRAKISDIVFRGVTARTPPRSVAAEIREQVGFSRDRSIRVAADQAAKMYSALDQARQEEAGIDHFLWVHSRKMNPRQIHVERNGILYKWKKSAGGPGRDPPPDMPGYLPYCGCTAQAVMLGLDGKPL
jgi:SPP1 gp7 family putative phage head morphogenesis protein